MGAATLGSMFLGYLAYRLIRFIFRAIFWSLWTCGVLTVALVVFLYGCCRELAHTLKKRHRVAKETLHDEYNDQA